MFTLKSNQNYLVCRTCVHFVLWMFSVDQCNMKYFSVYRTMRIQAQNTRFLTPSQYFNMSHISDIYRSKRAPKRRTGDESKKIAPLIAARATLVIT